MWKRQENRNSGKSPDLGGSKASPSLEECPECHSAVQSGRFCTSCGARLANKHGTPISSGSGDIQQMNVDPRDGFYVGFYR